MKLIKLIKLIELIKCINYKMNKIDPKINIYNLAIAQKMKCRACR